MFSHFPYRRIANSGEQRCSAHRVAVSLLLIIGLSLAARATNTAHAADEPRAPNIVVILSDDMGYSDIGCYGGEINTPHLDRLAAGGLRFSQFYNTGRCCPTRASLLTGLYPHQAGVGHMMQQTDQPGYQGNLNQQCRTIAEVLKTAGYKNYMSGKWHVTRHIGPQGPKFNWPRQRGFDRFYGMITGAGSFYDPATLTRDNKQITPDNDPEYRPESYYFTHAVTDQAVRYVTEHEQQSDETPFFLYVSYTAAHWPMHALPEDIKKYQGKYDEGYEAIRARRLERVRELGLIEPKWKSTPIAGNWNQVPEASRAWEAAGMEVYAAMVDSMDQGIGKIVDTLEKNGELDNTLILYLQDNGGCAEGVGRRGDQPKADKPTLEPKHPDQLTETIFPKQTRDGWPVRRGPKAWPGPADTYVAYGKNWANVSNTPFREYKHWVHEGGIATPLIAHWPAGISRHGKLEHQPGHLIDIMATCVDLSGAKYPSEVETGKVHPMEGRSLAPAFAGKPLEREAIYWEHEGNRAIRVGDWKLVAKGRAGPWELYDMAKDRTETNNLAASEPERVAELTKQWIAWAERANVLPLTPWNKRKKK